MYKGLSSKFFYSLFFLGLFLNINTVSAQADKVGSYSYKVSKDGYEANIKLYIYQESGETYARMRAEGNGQFGQPWEINLWSLQNGDYIDFYYELNPDKPEFTQDTHIMTLSGGAKKPLAVFGKELKMKVKKMKPADLLTWESEEPTFTIKEKAKSQTVEIKKNK